MNEDIRVHLVSLGCARNLVDSEVLLGHVAREGLAVARSPDDADVVVINTCGFIDEAKQESIDAILAAGALKKGGRLKGVVAVGCLAERYGADLAQEIPELDAVMGISDYSGVPAVVRKLVNGSEARFVATVDGGRPKAAANDRGRVLLTPKSYAYLRISEGCDHKCTFCAIPKMRGRNRSKPIDVLVDEARELAQQGVVELVVVAEDTTAYGLDTDRKRRLHELLERLGEVDGIRWIRLMYAYPHTVQPELTTVLREHPKIVPYLDIPIQHVAGNMLRAMKRGVSKEQMVSVLQRLRDEVPGLAVRSTYIVGFPGETDEDFGELLEFTREFEFERLGVFAYSHEEGTPAFDLADQIPAEVAAERRDLIMRVQQGIMARHQQGHVGRTLDVLVDGRDPDGGEHSVGRTVYDAPEVDGVVKLPAGLEAGRLLPVRITAADGYDLVGEPAS